MLGLFNRPFLSFNLTRYTQQTEASHAAVPNNDQSSPTLITLPIVEDKSLCARLKSSLLIKLAEKILALSNRGLQANTLDIATKLKSRKFYVDFAWSKLTELREKFLAGASQEQQPIDPLTHHISKLPVEIQEMIWQQADIRPLYWQAHTIPTYQNKPAYFLRNENGQLVLDDHHQAIHDPRYRLHLLTRGDIPREYQLKILAYDPQFRQIFCDSRSRNNLLAQFHTLFCDAQFRIDLLAQLTQKPFAQIAIDINIQQCALLLFFLRTTEEVALEEYLYIIDIFERYLAQAQPEIVGQALVELIQYLPCIPHFDALQLRAIKLVRKLSLESDGQAKPIWVGAVCANLVLAQNTSTLAVQALLLSRLHVTQHREQMIEYLHGLVQHLEENNAQNTELILLAHLRNYPLLKKEHSRLQRQISDIVKSNLSKITKELQRTIRTFQAAPQQKLISLGNILVLQAFLDKTQRANVSNIIKTNMRYFPKELWTPLFLFSSRPQLQAN